ncbi:MAG TPA: hypothetical protein PLV59_00160 [Candidatus Dojkabacteria bacterium]|nr:hypothetical protein [Candidatus Dojkabacteria bacterium]
MTRIIIAGNKEERERLLLKQISELIGRDISTLVELLKIPDVHYITSTEGSLGIEEVKGFAQKMMYAPFEEKYQFAIIDEAQTLTVEAQNSLLKALEESKDDTIFFILVPSERSLLDTILSRGIKYYGSSRGNDYSSELVDGYLGLNTVEKLAFMEKLAKEKEREEIVFFLNSLLDRYKGEFEKKLKEGKGSTDLVAKITGVSECIEAVGGSANKKLALFNLVVQEG